MALVYIRPDADSVDGSWVNASGNNTNLFDSVDESVASDSDYIRSSNNPANDIVKLRLSNFASTPIEPMTVRYRFKKVVSASEVLSMKARLVQGSTTIAEWEHSEVVDTYVDAEQELTAGQFALISDFTDLYLEFEAISGALEIDSFSASYLLTGEDSGFAINATSPGDTLEADYTGQSIGGSVVATSYDDAPLDASNLVQAGTSPKMVHWNSAPYARYAPHNRIDNETSESFSSWTHNSAATVTSNTHAAPDGTTTADTLEDTDGANIRDKAANIFDDELQPEGPWCFSVYVRKTSGATNFPAIAWYNFSDLEGIVCNTDTGVITGITGTVMGQASSAAVTSGKVDAGSYWRIWTVSNRSSNNQYRCMPAYNGDASSAPNTATTGSAVFWGAQLNRGWIPTPYIASTGTTRIGIPQGYDIDYDIFGILVEPAVTNLLLQTENLGTTWTNSNSTETVNATTAPDGQLSADKLVEASDTGQIHSITQTSASVTSGTTYVFSCYLKAGERTWARLAGATTRFADNFHCDFNLSTGVKGTVGAGATISGIQTIGDGWYRCYIGAACDSTGTNDFTITIGEADADVTFNGNGTNGIYVWGAQLEAGSFPTSYVFAGSSSVTRAVDAITVTASSIAYSTTACTLYADVKARVAPDATDPSICEISADTDNRYGIRQDDANPIQYNIDGGASDTSDFGTIVGNTRTQLSAAFTSADFDASQDGVTAVADALGTLDSTAAASMTFRIGGTVSSASVYFNGFIYRLVYVPRQVETEDGDIETWRYAF